MPRQIRIVCLHKVAVLCFVNNGKTQHRALVDEFNSESTELGLYYKLTEPGLDSGHIQE